MVEKPAAPLRIAIAGSGGRMGQTLIEAVLSSADLCLSAALEVAASDMVGRDSGERLGRESGVIVTDDVTAALAVSDVLVDFTRPEGSLRHLQVCCEQGVAAVVGTTGFSAIQKDQLASYARAIPLVFSPNMSVGINVLLKLVELAARQLGDDYDVEILEMHHRHKVDAPSGTALRLGEAVATAMRRDLQANAVYARRGNTGERASASIGFATLRGGDVVGDHTVIFAAPGERVEITHKASSRATFAAGALRAARFAAAKKRRNETGLYDMADVLTAADGMTAKP